MPRQAILLDPIPEEEEVEPGVFRNATPDEIYLLMTTALECPCCSVYHHAPTPDITQVASQASILAPQPRYGTPFEHDNITHLFPYISLPSAIYEYSPPSSPSPSTSSTSSTSSFNTAPTSPAPTVLDDHNPHQPQSLLEIIKQRTQTRLQQTDLSNSFFTKWAIVTTNMFGGVIPPESRYSVPPFALPSYDGQVRLRFIARSLGMSLATLTVEVEKFLSRNLCVIMCLVYNIVTNPDLIFDGSYGFSCGVNVDRPSGKKHNQALLCAIQQLEWTDPDVIEAVRLSMADDVGALATLFKNRVSYVLPDVSQTMEELVLEDSELEHLDSYKLHKMAVQQMRENRPHSLLRYVVRPEDVVA